MKTCCNYKKKGSISAWNTSTSTDSEAIGTGTFLQLLPFLKSTIQTWIEVPWWCSRWSNVYLHTKKSSYKKGRKNLH